MRFLGLIIGLTTFALCACTVHALDRLGVRLNANGYGVFYNTVTGKNTYLRGNNYFRGDPVAMMPINFRVGKYDREKHKGALQLMRGYGYNTLRAPLIYLDMGNPNGSGLNPAYLDNVIDYLKEAEANQIYTIFVIGYLPREGGYWPSVADPNFADQGSDFLQQLILQKEFVAAKARYTADILTYLKNKGVNLASIVGWQIENEPFYDLNKKPFSLNSGLVTAANGKKYDMALPSDKRAMWEEGQVYYMNVVRQAMKAIDPAALVGMAFTTPAVFPTSYPGQVINQSEADFIDIHVYPGANPGHTVDSELAQIPITNHAKPIILGEFGAYPHIYPTLAQGALALQAAQIKTCAQHGFQGWLAYDWDTYEYEPLFVIYQVTEGGGEINQALAPVFRRNPCLADKTTAVNILGKVEGIDETGRVTGYLYDLDSPDGSTINFYLDNAFPPVGKLIGSATTSHSRPDLTTSHSWFGEKTGFSFDIPQEYLTDGQSHTIYAQAFDKNLNGTVGSYLIPNSGLATPQVAELLPGDLNRDGHINLADFNLLIINFGNPYSIFDFNNILRNFGKWNLLMLHPSH